MFQTFETRSADEAWRKLVQVFRNGGRTTTQKSRGGETKEILHVGLSISDPRQRWMYSRRPALNPAFAIAEVVWIVTGRNDSAFLNYFNSQLPKYAGKGKKYHGAYGHRLRSHLGIDQLERAYRALANDPESRQVVLQIWDARVDLPKLNGKPSSPDVPCNLLSMLKVRNGTLEWTQIMRSNDLFRGLPHNIVQFTSLQEVLAGWLGLNLGAYNHFSDSLHIYHETIDQISIAPERLRGNNDSLMLPKKESRKAFAEVERIATAVIDPKNSSKKLVQISAATSVPPAYRNFVCVLCAEGTRRRKSYEEMVEIMGHCSNPLLEAMFREWNQRCRTKRSVSENGQS